jgi:hypothetical protein
MLRRPLSEGLTGTGVRRVETGRRRGRAETYKEIEEHEEGIEQIGGGAENWQEISGNSTKCCHNPRHKRHMQCSKGFEYTPIVHICIQIPKTSSQSYDEQKF